MKSLLLPLVAIAPLLAGGADVPEGHVTALPPYVAADPSAAEVTEAILLASERFWPYQVALREPFQPPGRAQLLPVDVPGVLIRVEPSGVARIDFGRDGLYEIPIVDTDVVERANDVRLGALSKLAPNFLAAIGPRLLDSGADSIIAFDFARAAARRYFVCVFADPSAPGFDGLVLELAPLGSRAEVQTILFPMGHHPEHRMREQLRRLEWTVPFIYDHLTEPYAQTLLGDGIRTPALTLQTGEGRLLFQGEFRGDAARRLLAALDAVTLPASAAVPAGH